MEHWCRLLLRAGGEFRLRGGRAGLGGQAGKRDGQAGGAFVVRYSPDFVARKVRDALWQVRPAMTG